MNRKSVDALSSTLSVFAKKKNRQIMNDIVYYLRKLLTLAKSSQKLSLYESKEIVNELAEIEKEVIRIEEELNK